MKSGISDSVFPSNWTLERTLKFVSKVGFDGIEYNVQEKGGILNFDTLSHQADSLVEKCKKFNLEISSLSTLLHNKYPLNSPDKRVRDYGERVALKMIELAQIMHVKVIQIVPGIASPIIPYKEAYRLSQRSIESLAQIASNAGVTLGIENVSNNFLSSPMEFTNFLNEVNHPSVQGYLDIGNAKAVGYPEHWISLLNQQIVSIHAKDFSLESKEFKPVLSGDIDWLSAVRNLKEIGFSGYIISTPPKQYKYCPERLIETAYNDLQAVLQLN